MIKTIEQHYRQNFTTLVKRMAWRCGGNTHDAEDIVQEAYIRAIKYKEAFDTGLAFNLWFSRILSNALKDFKREEKGYSNSEEVEEHHFEPVDDPSIPDGVRREIKYEIDSLPPLHKEIVTLHHIYGYDLRQIVQIVDVKYKNADLIIQRFKKALKEKYAEVR